MSDAIPKRGRPRAAEPSTNVCTWLKTKDYDRLLRLAARRDTSVSAILRRLVVTRLPRR